MAFSNSAISAINTIAEGQVFDFTRPKQIKIVCEQNKDSNNKEESERFRKKVPLPYQTKIISLLEGIMNRRKLKNRMIISLTDLLSL